MSSTSQLRGLTHPAVIAAFTGWNDAGEAASGVVDHLVELTSAEFVFSIDPDDFYDFTENRPMVSNTETGERLLRWPTVEVFLGKLGERHLVLVVGPEPNYHWREFCGRLVSAIRSVEPEHVILLGAMLADSPHRRPIPVSQDSAEYEGPTGILGVLAQACRDARLPVASLWAAVPHYVSDPPNPKATLALLGKVEDILDEALDVRDLPEESSAWEGRVNDLAAGDPDVEQYITSLEENYDEDAEPGDMIAEEFERYLRRRER